MPDEVASLTEPPPEPVRSREDRIEQFKKDVVSKDDAVRLAALQSARDLRDKGVRALLARRLENEPDGIRIAAAQALSFQKHPEAAAALRTLAGGPVPRWAAAARAAALRKDGVTLKQFPTGQRLAA